jgi:hypothetical protein
MSALTYNQKKALAEATYMTNISYVKKAMIEVGDKLRLNPTIEVRDKCRDELESLTREYVVMMDMYCRELSQIVDN